MEIRNVRRFRGIVTILIVLVLLELYDILSAFPTPNNEVLGHPCAINHQLKSVLVSRP